MKQLSPGQIEELNAYGPYNHAVWRRDGIEVTHEERISGRGDKLVEVIRGAIVDRFTTSEIESMRIVDIGCYDGWLLQQLQDLPFLELVGIEPRRKNIQKGHKVREILGIETRVRFEQGTIEALQGRDFDVVLCIGLLHHLPSLSIAFERLREACSQLLILDSLCLSSACTTDALEREIEMKDMVYRFRPLICGVTGHKLESSYYDGSTCEGGVVSVPSVNALRMYLDSNGFADLRELISVAEYAEILRAGGRTGNAICLAARPRTTRTADENDWISEYECGLMRERLDARLLNALECEFVNVGDPLAAAADLPESVPAVSSYIKSPPEQSGDSFQAAASHFATEYAQEIIKNMRFNPREKIALECAKEKYFSRDFRGAIDQLRSITEQLNADWRAVYRSFFLLSRCYQECGDEAKSQWYLDLCRTSNERFPCARLRDL